MEVCPGLASQLGKGTHEFNVPEVYKEAGEEEVRGKVEIEKDPGEMSVKELKEVVRRLHLDVTGVTEKSE